MKGFGAVVAKAHPILECEKIAKIFWEGTTTEHRPDKVKKRPTLMTSTGFYLLREVKFPAGWTVSKHLVYEKIISINVDENKLVLNGTVRLTTAENGVAAVLGARLAYYTTRMFPSCKVVVEEAAKSAYDAEYDKFSQDFSEKTILSDRFVSFAAKSLPRQLNELANELYQSLTKSTTSAMIVSNIASSQLMKPLADAIAYDTKITHLKLKGVILGSFAPQLRTILARNKSIEMISFIDFDFAGFCKASGPLFSEAVSVPLQEFRFIRSGCNRPEFINFVHDFTCFQGDIKRLKMDSCVFDEETIDQLFVSFFDAQCFEHLEKFELSLTSTERPEVSMIERIQTLMVQLLGSNWILKHRELSTMAATDAHINVEFMVPLITLLENGLCDISFAGNFFKEPIERSPYFANIEKLDLSKCEFTCASLISLFDAISSGCSKLAVLYLDNLEISANDRHRFYEKMSKYNFPALECFSWCKNCTDDKDLDSLFKFIRGHKNMKCVYLSQSLCNGTSGRAVSGLCDMIKAVPLESLVLKADSITQMGDKGMLKILTALEKKNLKHLDIQGQVLKDGGLAELEKLLRLPTMTEISFDGTKGTYQRLVSTLEAFINSNLTMSQWPEEDMREHATKDEVMDLKRKFAAKFGLFDAAKAKVEYISQENRIRPPAARRESEYLHTLDMEESPGLLMGMDTPVATEKPAELNIMALGAREPTVSHILQECLIDVSTEQDILVKFVRELEQATSYTRLL